jgi:hypothetical protein
LGGARAVLKKRRNFGKIHGSHGKVLGFTSI